jgi:hypothetical protein
MRQRRHRLGEAVAAVGAVAALAAVLLIRGREA